MSMMDKITEQLRDAMKSGDDTRAATLKMLKSDIMYEKAKTGEEPGDEKVMEIIARAAKRRKESIAEYTKGGRPELAASEEAELTIIEEYLPKQLSDSEIEEELKALLASMGSPTKKDFGRVMGQCMKEFKGRAEGDAVRRILTALLPD